MSNHRIPARIAGRAQNLSFAQSVLITCAILLLLTLFSGWLLDLSQAIVLATALLIGMLGLSAIGLQMALGERRTALLRMPAQGAQQHGQATAADNETSDITADIQALQGKRWSLDVFAAIDAQRFAAVCETWFSSAGFDTRYESHRSHDGVDIWLHASRLPGPVAIVRCKHTQDKPVSLRDMQEFQGVVARCQSAHGTFTTTSTYTPEALQYAREHHIEAVDGKALLRRIMTRTRQSQQALLAVAFRGR